MANGGMVACAALVLGLTQYAAGAEEKYQVVIDPSNSYGFVVHGWTGRRSHALGRWDGGRTGAGPASVRNEKATDGKLAFASPIKLGKTDADVAQFGLEAQSTGQTASASSTRSPPQKELPLTAIVATLGAPAGGQINAVLTDTAGAEKSIKLPSPAWRSRHHQEHYAQRRNPFRRCSHHPGAADPGDHRRRSADCTGQRETAGRREEGRPDR